MEQNILTVSGSIDKLCLENIMEKKHVSPDMSETDLKVDLKMICNKNDIENDAILDKNHWYFSN